MEDTKPGPYEKPCDFIADRPLRRPSGEKRVCSTWKERVRTFEDMWTGVSPIGCGKNEHQRTSTHQTSGNTTCPFLETRCYMRWQYSLRRIVLFWWPDIATVLRTKRNCHDQIVLTFKPWLSFWLRWCQNALCERWHPRLLSCGSQSASLRSEDQESAGGKGDTWLLHITFVYARNLPSEFASQDLMQGPRARGGVALWNAGHVSLFFLSLISFSFFSFCFIFSSFPPFSELLPLLLLRLQLLDGRSFRLKCHIRCQV